jgi:hypothetical protein
MKYRLQIFLLSLITIIALTIPVQGHVEASVMQTLAPTGIVIQSGGISGDIASLAVADQSGTQDDPSKYVSFVTPSRIFKGYATFQLPNHVNSAMLVTMNIAVNYRGPAKSSQLWSWYLFDFIDNVWVKVGDNTTAAANVWSLLTFSPVYVRRYADSNGVIQLLAKSSNSSSDAKIDYENIAITYTSLTVPPPPSAFPTGKIPAPPAGDIYQGVYPGGFTGEEDDITLNDLLSYQETVGKTAAWTYFSDNWYHGRTFPLATATWIRNTGSVPYIRLMLRSNANGNGGSDPAYSLQKIINGYFDSDLHAWCASAHDFGSSLIVEYGTEMNGNWFSWNGQYAGGGRKTGYGDPTLPDGPERFRDAYRHIIDICNAESANNITWVFHVNDGDYPDVSWNRFENYYPGDAYIDWIAVSVYSAQTPTDKYWTTFRSSMDNVYPRLAALTVNKPIIVAEFGATKNNPLGDQAVFAHDALNDLITFRYPRVIGFSWWNEWWQNDNNPFHDTTMRVQDNPNLAQTFIDMISTNSNVLGQIP